jgi:Sec-independent protein translocase protein TatA
MKPRIITTAAVMGLLLVFGAGELCAAGPGNGGGRGQVNGAGGGMKQQFQMQSQSEFRTQTQTRTRAHAQTTGETMSASRSADSQRRDGTFLTTGTTANGSTTRPDQGQGVQDGSHLNTTTTTATVPTAAP